MSVALAHLIDLHGFTAVLWESEETRRPPGGNFGSHASNDALPS